MRSVFGVVLGRGAGGGIGGRMYGWVCSSQNLLPRAEGGGVGGGLVGGAEFFFIDWCV